MIRYHLDRDTSRLFREEGGLLTELYPAGRYALAFGLSSWARALETSLVILLDYLGEEYQPNNTSLKALKYVAEVAATLQRYSPGPIKLVIEAGKIAEVVVWVNELFNYWASDRPGIAY